MWLLQAAVPIPAYVQMLSVSAGFQQGFDRVRTLLPPISSVFGASTEDMRVNFC